VGTAANVSDVSQAHAFLHGHEEGVFGNAGYLGVDKRDEMTGHTVEWQIAAKRGKIKAMREGLKDRVVTLKRTKTLIEHPFHVVTNLFRHRKAFYKGLARNTAQFVQPVCASKTLRRENQSLSIYGDNPSSV